MTQLRPQTAKKIRLKNNNNPPPPPHNSSTVLGGFFCSVLAFCICKSGCLLLFMPLLLSPSEEHTYLCPVREQPLTGTVIFLAGLLGGQFGGGTEGLRKLQEAPISHALFAKNLAFLDAPAAGPGTLGEEEKADSA